MCSNEDCNKACIGKILWYESKSKLSETRLIKSALEYAIRKVQEKQGWNWMGQITFWCMTKMVIYWKKHRCYQEEHGKSIRASKADVLDATADEAKYMLMSTQIFLI